MNKIAAALTLATLALGSLPATAQTAGGYAPQGQRLIGGQWMTLANGCSYSRTQAPGQPVQWILIHNPHHIGGRVAHRGCASIIQG